MRIFALIVLASAAWAQTDTSMLLWYRQPATQWVEALPIGNGRMGAMVFGKTGSEVIQLNEDTVWAGEKRDRVNPAGRAALPEIRRLLFAGQPQAAEALAERTMMGTPKRLPPYETLGDLTLDFGAESGASEYRRQLDLENGLVRIQYRKNGVFYRREVFASAPRQLIVIRIWADRKNSISFRARLSREVDAVSDSAGPDSILLRGEAIIHSKRNLDQRKVGVKFAAVLEAFADGARVASRNGILSVGGAMSVTLLLAASTSIRSPDPLAECRRRLASAPANYSQLLSEHIEDQRKFSRRAHLTLPRTANSALPTDDRIRGFQQGRSDPELAALYFHYARYLLMACSRPGSMPANLQGIWNNEIDPRWESKYTININTEMNYWPVEVANLAEMHEPLFDLIDTVRVSGRDTARRPYGTKGFVVHHNTDLWGHTAPVDGVIWGLWPTGGAWLSLDLWEHYDFSRDRAFLEKRAYPVLREAAEFFLENLFDDGEGHLVTGPSISPELGYVRPDGVKATLTMGPYMDTEIVRALFSRVIEGSTILGIDKEFRERVAEARAKLPPFRIGRRGQLQEWLQDYDEMEPHHRHVSHLFAVYPGHQIAPDSTPELARAAERSLELRGDGNVGWSRAWMINLYARLHRPERAYAMLTALLREHTNPNLFDGCYAGRSLPFQIDANFGGAAGIAEMLLQSQGGEVSLLPALPAPWPEGSFRGLRARGGLELDAAWAGGLLSRLTIRASVAGPQKFRVPRTQTVRAIRSQGVAVPFQAEDSGRISVAMAAAKSYEFEFGRTKDSDGH